MIPNATNKYGKHDGSYGFAHLGGFHQTSLRSKPNTGPLTRDLQGKFQQTWLVPEQYPMEYPSRGVDYRGADYAGILTIEATGRFITAAPLMKFQSANSVDLPPYRVQLSGPIQFIQNLLETWMLTQDDAVPLLGFEISDRHHVKSLLRGHAVLSGRDVKDRIAYLFEIRKTLSALFLNEDVENAWLREEHAMLGNNAPLKLMLEGTMDNLLLVKEYVEAAAGR